MHDWNCSCSVVAGKLGTGTNKQENDGETTEKCDKTKHFM